MAIPETVQSALDAQSETDFAFLLDSLRYDSISADSEHHDACRSCAEHLADRLRALGFTASLEPTSSGLPIVAARLDVDPDAPSLLCYGHYDVQPVDPLDLWETPPFEPTVDENGFLRARGAADDKGPTLTLIDAAAAWIAAEGGPPLNLRFLIEGEEECGGHGLGAFLAEHGDAWRSDHLVIFDAPAFAPTAPSLIYALRGMAGLEVRLQGPCRDLHSGLYGGPVANPAEWLAKLLATLRAEDGAVAVEGFYDGVEEPTVEERARLGALAFDEAAFAAEVGSGLHGGETAYTVLERRWCRPTLEVNGIASGYAGEGLKTVLPAEAVAKISCRLVPGQEPGAVLSAIRDHLEERCPPGMELVFQELGSAPAAAFPDSGAPVDAALAALREAYGNEPVLVREGASIPVVFDFLEHTGTPPMLLGVYRPGEKAHSPNEQLHVEDWERARMAAALLMQNLAAIPR